MLRPATRLSLRVSRFTMSTSLFSTTSRKHSEAASPNPESPLAGTAPKHTAYVLLHTQHPPHTYPSKVPSKLQRALMLPLLRHGVVVNHGWLPWTEGASDYLSGDEEGVKGEWDVPVENEMYRASAYSFKGRLDLPCISMTNLDEVVETLRIHALLPESDAESIAWTERVVKQEEVHLFVCTHGTRGCRCGDVGGAVFRALSGEVRKRGLERRVRVGAVGHVGGHKYAANVLVYPDGEWLGQLQPEDAPRVIDAIMERRARTPSQLFRAPPLLSQFWRGRMGLDKEEQLGLYSSLTTSQEQVRDDSMLKPHVSRLP